VVPGGGVEPPRAEARRILSRRGASAKSVKSEHFQSLRKFELRGMCGSVRSYRDLSLTVYAQSGRAEAGWNLPRVEQSPGFNHLVSFSVLPVFQFFWEMHRSGRTALIPNKGFGQVGIRTLDIVGPYSGLAIAHKFVMHNVFRCLQSDSGAPSRGSSLSIGTKCSPFCSPTLINQARRVGKHIGRPSRRRLGLAEIEKSDCCDRRGRACDSSPRSSGLVSG
jgi:hypothetical protein